MDEKTNLVEAKLSFSLYAYIGILGGIGVGFSAQYGWQAVFNTFGALAIAAETYGLQGAVSLRVSQNVFGVVFALAFCVIFYWFMSKKTVHAGLNVRFNEEKQITSDNEIQKWAKQIAPKIKK